MSKCKVCNERDAVAGYRGKCLQCGRLYLQQWREKNREKSRGYARSYRQKAKNSDIIDERRYPVPNYLRGQVEVCRAMKAASLSSKPCVECGKMASEVHEREGEESLRLCRECHVKYH